MARQFRVLTIVIVALAAITSLIALLRAVWLAVEVLIAESVPVKVMANLTGFSAADDLGFAHRVTTGSLGRLELSLAGLGGGARSLLAGGELVSGLTPVVLGLGVVMLGLRVLRERPFTRLLSVVLWIQAATLLAVPVLGQVLTDLGSTAALDQLQLGLPYVRMFRLTEDPALFLTGLAMAAIACLCQIGQRFQRDTDGLI